MREITEDTRKLIIKLDRLKRRIAMAQNYAELSQGELREESLVIIDRLSKQYAKLGGDNKLRELLDY